MDNFLKGARLVVEYISNNIVAEASTPAIGSVHRLPSNVGWVFYYNTEEAFVSGDPLDGYAGNAPIIYDQVKDALHITGTALPTEVYVEQYLKDNGY